MKKILGRKPLVKGVTNRIEAVNLSRRGFLVKAGFTTLATGILLASCEDDDDGGAVPTLDAPSNLAADNSTTGQIDLSWTDNTADEDGFEIERATENDDSAFSKIADVGADVTTYSDTTIDAGTEYFYRVRAVNDNVSSDYSNVVSSTGDTAVRLGSGDTGILNYAYALEQLEAAFYTQVATSFYADIPSEEQRVLEALQKHEVAHKDFYSQALGENAIPSLSVDFSSIDFDDRMSVLTTAKTFEDLGVAAYNGAGKLLENPDFLLVAGKIVSVEARHAATIRDILEPNSASFAGDDVIDENGLDRAMAPAEVLEAAGAFITTQIDASELPS